MTTPAAPPPDGTASRGDRRRAELLAGGIACLERDGWAGLTHRRVAEEAGATTGLVRYHFGSLAGLRTAIADEASTRLLVPAIDALCATSTSDDLRGRTVEVMTALLDDRRGAGLLAEVVLGSTHYPEVEIVVVAALDAALGRLATHLVALDPRWEAQAARGAAELLLATTDGLALAAIGRRGSSAVAPAQLEELVGAILSPA